MEEHDLAPRITMLLQAGRNIRETRKPETGLAVTFKDKDVNNQIE